MHSILFVDDHTILRKGVIKVLQEVVALPLTFTEASDGYSAILMTNANHYDLVLLDISLPDQNGLDLLKQIRLHHPKLPIVILSSYPDELYAVRALRAGAFGYLNKCCNPTILKEAVEKVLSGNKYVSPTQAEMLADAICDNREYKVLHESLSDREHVLACMLTAGQTITEIAKELNLSSKTISTYRTRILEKLQLKSTADIIAYCIEHKLTL